MDVSSADNFRPFFRAAPINSAPISYGRRPRHREDAFILDSELELQVLAPVIAIVASLFDELEAGRVDMNVNRCEADTSERAEFRLSACITGNKNVPPIHRFGPKQNRSFAELKEA
jgi:hypothetical protein